MSATTFIPNDSSSAAGPSPDSCRSCGELIEPPHRITCPARAWAGRPQDLAWLVKPMRDYLAGDLTAAGVEYFVFNVPTGTADTVRQLGEVLVARFAG